jgi:tetratricopeptide (TPR) repeat protein
MLFERIRRTQKPIFVFLAVTFALGFVLLGVGQGAGSINALDFLGGGSSSSDPTSSLKDTVTKNPNDAAAWRQLAVAYQGQGDTDNAISAWESYLNLDKKNASGLSSASSLLENRAYYAQQNASAYQAAASFASTGADDTVLNALQATDLANPIAAAAASKYQTQAQTYSSQSSTDVQVALGYRQTLAKLSPSNALNQLALGYDAANAQQYPIALTALKKYLVLAPSSTQAAQVKSVVKQLEAITASAPTQ